LHNIAEYGVGCKISVEGDIYSYGIILLEIITGRRPTDDMFKDGVNIRNFVESSLPLNIHNILEPNLTGYHEGADGGQEMVEMQHCAM